MKMFRAKKIYDILVSVKFNKKDCGCTSPHISNTSLQEPFLFWYWTDHKSCSRHLDLMHYKVALKSSSQFSWTPKSRKILISYQMSKISYFRFFPLFGGTIGQDIIRNCSCILRQIFFRILKIKIKDADLESCLWADVKLQNEFDPNVFYLIAQVI